MEMDLRLLCPGRSEPCQPRGLQVLPSPSMHEMNCPPTSAGRGIGPETRLCHLSAMNLRVSRGSIVLCIYRRCRMNTSRRIRPRHSSRFHRSTMNTGLCLWRCHGLYIAPSWGACCFVTCPVLEAVHRRAALGKTSALGAGDISRRPMYPLTAESWFIRRPRKGRCLEPIKSIKISLVFHSPHLL